MTIREIESKLQAVAAEYPANMVAHQVADIPRIAYNIALALPTDKPLNQAVICDIGGGIGLFSVGCAAIGFGKVILVDDFGDQINKQVGTSIFDLHRRYAVRVVSRDAVAEGLGDVNERFDAVTSFDSLEHWHNSPKRLFHEVMAAMRPGGRFVLGVPNCVNLRKRITGLLGRNKWSAMEHWYEPEVFRGHVREPDVQDLLYIAKDLGLKEVNVFGRNWQGYYSNSKLTRLATKLMDRLIWFNPSLCADIYLVGRKP
jgi:SAM-dependent methyltransferase